MGNRRRKKQPNPHIPAGYVSAELARVKRRKFVAESILINQLSLREIAELMTERGIVNPNGDSWSLQTVADDITKLREQWQIDASASFAQMAETQLAKIRAGQAEAWARGDLQNYARFIDQEIKLTGTAFADRAARESDSDAVTMGDGWTVADALDRIVGKLEERRRLTLDGESEIVD